MLEAARNGGIALNAVVDDHRRIANMLRIAQDAGLLICEGAAATSLLAGQALEELNNAFVTVRPGFWLRLDQVIESESLSAASPQLGLEVLKSRLRGGGIERDWAAISGALANPHPWFAARWEILPLPHHGYEFRRRPGTP